MRTCPEGARGLLKLSSSCRRSYRSKCPFGQTTEQCTFIEKEISGLKRQQARAAVQTAQTQLELECRNVPDRPVLDRLLRYEVTLERGIDRTLSQLERLQRMRKGQPVLPELKVRHSLS
jgi:hypothetical protein